MDSLLPLPPVPQGFVAQARSRASPGLAPRAAAAMAGWGSGRGSNTGYSLSRVDGAGSGDGTLMFSGAVRDGSMCWRSSEVARR